MLSILLMAIQAADGEDGEAAGNTRERGWTRGTCRGVWGVSGGSPENLLKR